MSDKDVGPDQRPNQSNDDKHKDNDKGGSQNRNSEREEHAKRDETENTDDNETTSNDNSDNESEMKSDEEDTTSEKDILDKGNESVKTQCYGGEETRKHRIIDKDDGDEEKEVDTATSGEEKHRTNSGGDDEQTLEEDREEDKQQRCETSFNGAASEEEAIEIAAEKVNAEDNSYREDTGNIENGEKTESEKNNSIVNTVCDVKAEQQEESGRDTQPNPATNDRALESSTSDANDTVYDVDVYDEEQGLSNEDFMNKAQNDDLQIIRETIFWKEKYKLDDQAHSKGADELMQGNIDLDLEGLDDNQKAEIMEQRQGMEERSLTEIFDGIGSGRK